MDDSLFTNGFAHRARKNRSFSIAIMIPAAIVSLLLMAIIGQVFFNGIKAINWDFLIKDPKPFGETGGGILNGILGTFLICAVAVVLTLPTSILIAVFLSEKKNSRLAKWVQVTISSFQGIPSIVIGVVVYSWVVLPMKIFSALAGGIALALIMIPLVTGMTREVLLLMPESYMEAAISLGVSRWRALFGMILPAARTGILGAVGLGIARIAGETAPLLFTSFGNPFVNINPMKPTSSIPLIVYEYIKSPYDDWHQKAWGAAFLLVLIVLLLNLLVSFRKKSHTSRA
jgi:phosphate transport system permease protein